MAKGVQFRGIPAIVECFDNMSLSAWSLTYDKNIICKYPSKQTASTAEGSGPESREQLVNILKGLTSGESYAVYTLHLYESVPKGGIKPSTEPDYSYNFTVFERTGSYQEFNDSRPSIIALNEANAAKKKIEILEAKLAALENDDITEDRPGGIEGFLGALVNDERFKNKIQDFVFAFADKIFSAPSNNTAPVHDIQKYPNPAAVGSVSTADPILIDEVQHEKLQTAIDILIRIDAKLGDNLLKLAEKANQDKKKYESLVNMLKLL